MLTLPHHLQSAPPTLSILCRQYTESVAVVTLSRKLYQVVAMANKPQSAPGSTSKVRIWPVNPDSSLSPPPWRFLIGSSVEYVVSPLSYSHRVSV